MAAPSISVRRLCRSQRVEAAPCHCVAEQRKAPLCHRLSPRCGTMPLRFISWRYRALPLPRLSSLGNALALLWYATFCLALARLIASIRSNAVALLLETELCRCSTSHVDALPLLHSSMQFLCATSQGSAIAMLLSAIPSCALAKRTRADQCHCAQSRTS